MTFDLAFDELQDATLAGGLELRGTIRVGALAESFVAPLTLWNRRAMKSSGGTPDAGFWPACPRASSSKLMRLSARWENFGWRGLRASARSSFRIS